MAAPQVFLDIDLTPQPSSGLAYFYPTVQVTDPTEGITLTTEAQGFPFDGTLKSIQLYATDNANMGPAGWAWFLDFSQNPSVPGKPSPITFFAPAGPLSFTATSASPAVFTWTSNAAFMAAFPESTLPNGTAIVLSGNAPAGFTNGTTYYVTASSAHSFSLAASRGGSAIASTGTGTGTFTVTRYTYSGLVPQGSAVTFSPFLTSKDNLAGLANVAAAQANLGLGTAAVKSAASFASVVNASPSTVTGAVFDGVTDDHAALVASQVANQTLFLPNGTAPVSTTVTLGTSGLYFRGSGMYSTTIKAEAAQPVLLYGAAYVPQVEISDMTIDGSNIATVGLGAYGIRIGRLTLRRCRFINFPASIIEAGYSRDYVIEDCVAEGGGLGVATFFSATTQPVESLIVRRNKIRYMNQGIVIGSSGFHAAYVEITDNEVDGGWYLLKAANTGSGGTVTYTSTGLTDTSASFGAIPNTSPSARYVRALNPRQSSAFTTVNGTYIADTAATFVTNGLKRGEIIRSGAVFAVVSKVISETVVHVEEWLSSSAYLPAAPPAVGASYTAYAVYLGCINANTATTLTVQHGQGGGGGGWFDLTGANVTPPSGCLYEVLSASGGYPVFAHTTTEKLIVHGNRVRRGRFDNMELFGTHMIVTDNIAEDGQDEGIVIQGASVAVPSHTSVIEGNLLLHNGSSGLFLGECANVEVGPNQYRDNCWTTPSTNNLGQVSVAHAVDVNILGGRATNSAESLPSVGLKIDGTETARITVSGFTGAGHTLGDVYVTSTVPAAACDLLDVTGTITYQGTVNGQRLRVKGSGVPALIASPGSAYVSTAGGAGTTSYVKETGNGSAGWAAQAVASNLGAQVAYNTITANITQVLTATYAAVTGAPTVTLPNDGGVYRLELTIPLVEVNAAGVVNLALATSPTGVINAISTDIVAATRQYNIIVPAQKVTGSGQVVTLYALCSAAPTLTVFAGAGGASSIGPCELAAYRIG